METFFHLLVWGAVISLVLWLLFTFIENVTPPYTFTYELVEYLKALSCIIFFFLAICIFTLYLIINKKHG